MKVKKILLVSLTVGMVVGQFTGCGTTTKQSKNDKGSVYYLSFKPEQAKQWETIAAKYTKETGVKVKVMTAASGQYEQTLKSEIAKKNAPTLFQINGPVGYQNWKDYCADLSHTKLYFWLKDPDMAVKAEKGVYGIPYVVEGYGIIYNQEIMDKYFALGGAKAVSIDEINNFTKLKEVAEDMTAKKKQLGIEGVFSSTSFAPGEDWRWQTHLMNLPIYYEYKDAGVSDEKEITWKYANDFKNIFDLYINHSVTKPSMLGSKSVEDSMSEFALGKSAMVQNGNWGWGQISEVEGNVVKKDKVKFLPIYTGVEGEKKQGLCIGTENFFSINNKATQADQKASIKFVEWLFSSDEGKQMVTKDLGFISPFNTFEAKDNPTDPLAQEVIRYLDNKDLYSVSWNFTSFPSQTFKDNFGERLLQYCTGSVKWDQVVIDTIADWKAEKEAGE
jgi:raffinose/stachyose/melibiose transport system substrate-binding protein